MVPMVAMMLPCMTVMEMSSMTVLPCMSVMAVMNTMLPYCSISGCIIWFVIYSIGNDSSDDGDGSHTCDDFRKVIIRFGRRC